MIHQGQRLALGVEAGHHSFVPFDAAFVEGCFCLESEQAIPQALQPKQAAETSQPLEEQPPGLKALSLYNGAFTRV
jgi:hypothetical protein